MGAPNVAEEILRFNAGRDPRRLKEKYGTMRESPFAFLRGSCHLFYRTLPRHELLRTAPYTWICGDLHFENFGSFRGNNRLTYFDLNDFEEACLAPCTWELLRLLSSVLVGAATLEIGQRKGVALCRTFMDAFRINLIDGKPRWIERSLAKGMVRDLLNEVEGRRRREFLDSRTRRRGGKRRLRVDGDKALETSEEHRREVTDALKRYARTKDKPGFYRVRDIADRIAGLGSLGVERYVVLVEGRGSPNRNYLLDIKEARPSAVSAYAPVRQHLWSDDGERIVTLQRLMQAISPALLTTISVGNRSFVLKELQPDEDRINLKSSHGKFRRLEGMMKAMGEVVAWGQLRGAGWRGAASREALRDFAQDDRWVRQIIELAIRVRRQVVRHWKEYVVAYESGRFTQREDSR